MTTAFLIWWHRVVLRHEQEPEMNGATEAGVWCRCRFALDWLRGWRSYGWRWFPSDGGQGR